MFRNTFQSNFLSLFSTSGSDCLELWGVRCDASFVEDADLHSNVLELRKNREAVQDIKDSFIVCPASIDKKLGITLPCFCLIVKNVNKIKNNKKPHYLNLPNYAFYNHIFICLNSISFLFKLDPFRWVIFISIHSILL